MASQELTPEASCTFTVMPRPLALSRPMLSAAFGKRWSSKVKPDQSFFLCQSMSMTKTSSGMSRDS